MHFLALRVDPHAQYEIRAYADVILGIVRRWAPLTAEAFGDFVLGEVRLPRQATEAVRRIIAGEDVELARVGVDGREWREVSEALGIERAG